MELKYTPKIINEIEVANGNKSFTVLLGDVRLKMLAMWIKKGMGLKTDEEAFDKMTEYLKEHSIEDLLIEIYEALQASGFLDRSKNIRELVNGAKEDLEEGKKVNIPQTL
jgi:hypothetical protein